MAERKEARPDPAALAAICTCNGERLPFSPMSESLHFTILFEDGDEGWIVASIPEVPGAHSQGRTREEARANVVDALRGILELRFGGAPALAAGADSERLKVVIGA